MPGHEKPLSRGIAVRETPAELRHMNQWAMGRHILTVTEERRDEARRCSHEWPRHIGQPSMIRAPGECGSFAVP